MESLLTYGAVGAVVVAIAGIGIWASLREARNAGAAKAQADAANAARDVEAQTSAIQGEVITAEDLKDRFKKGTFGGQDEP